MLRWKRCTGFVASLLVAGVLLTVSSTALAYSENMRPIGPLGDNDLAHLFGNTAGDIPPGIYFGGPVYDPVADQATDAVFTSSASGGAIATFVIEMTTSSASNRLGLYDFENATKKIELFDGSDGAGSQTFVSFLADGRVFVMFVDTGVTDFSGNFGFYLDVYDAPVATGGDGNPSTYDFTFFTEDSRNPGNAPQAFAYQGNGQTHLQIPPYAAGVFMSSDWIIAFEDAPVAGQYAGASDHDYSDLVVIVESIHPTDIPGRIPTVSEWGLAIMTLLLLTGGKVYFGHRRQTLALAQVSQ